MSHVQPSTTFILVVLDTWHVQGRIWHPGIVINDSFPTHQRSTDSVIEYKQP